MIGGRVKGDTSRPLLTLAALRSASDQSGRPLTRPRWRRGPTRCPSVALLSRKSALQQCSWQVLDDLAFCTQRYPRLAELAAQVLVEQQCVLPGVPVDPGLEALVPF